MCLTLDGNLVITEVLEAVMLSWVLYPDKIDPISFSNITKTLFELKGNKVSLRLKLHTVF